MGVLWLWWALAGPALGEPVEPGVDPAWAALGAAGAGAGWLGVHLAQPAMVETGCPCGRGQVNALDRVAVDALWPGAEPWADGVAAAGLLGSVAVAVLGAPSGEGLGDGLVVVEAAAVAGLLGALLKAAVGRPYPYMYRPAPYAEQNGDGVNYAAWPSGHTAAPMAAAVSAAVMLGRRRARWRWVWYVAGPAAALAAGALQVTASNHYPTDVVGGALLGAGVGVLVPALHGVF